MIAFGFCNPASIPCPDGSYFVDEIGFDPACIACDDLCSICTGSLTTECSACSEGNFLLLDQTSCFDNCPDGFFNERLTYTCEPCHLVCSHCFGGKIDECTGCTDYSGYILAGTTCQDPICA